MIITKIPKDYLLLGIIIILIIFISASRLGNTDSPTLKSNNLSEISSPLKIEKEENNVTVTIEYLREKSNSNLSIFAVSLDTHSENLDSFDFQKDISLIKKDISNLPVAVSESGSGHHRSAEVTFKSTQPPFEIILRNLAGVPKREFKFNNY